MIDGFWSKWGEVEWEGTYVMMHSRKWHCQFVNSIGTTTEHACDHVIVMCHAPVNEMCSYLMLCILFGRKKESHRVEGQMD